MRLPSQALPLLATALFLFFPNLASGSFLKATNPDHLIYDKKTGLYWTDGNFIKPDQTMTWEAANNWVASLNTTQYGGFNDWRLPYTPPGSVWGYDNNTTITKYEVTVSELGYLYYISLRQEGFWSKASCNSDGTCPNSKFPSKRDFSPFTHLLKKSYWFGTTEYLDTDLAAWSFDFGYGIQFLQSSNSSAHVIAVRGTHPAPEPSTALLLAGMLQSSNSSTHPAPEPSTALLFLAGMLGLCRFHTRQASRN